MVNSYRLEESSYNVEIPIVDRFKAFYKDLSNRDMSELQDIYDPDVVFKDPVHELRGLDVLHSYMTGLCAEVSECRFEYLDELISEQSAYIKWVMHFRHPKLGNRLISVRGLTHIQFDSHIVFHEDIYDMGAMLYEQVPVLGAFIRWLRLRLGR